MLSPPPELPEDRIAAVLFDEWSVRMEKIEYQPVGFGSHHWDALDSVRRRWFVTVDDLETKKLTDTESLDLPLGRLLCALEGAIEFHESGLTFVVAPQRTTAGDPLTRVSERFALALYPYISGRSFDFRDVLDRSHWLATIEILGRLHGSTASLLVDDFVIPQRDVLPSPLDRRGTGPYSDAIKRLIGNHNQRIAALLATYDEHVALFSREPIEMVPTHGEPHPGNLMAKADGLVLVDWDTALLAPRERDLWFLEAESGSPSEAYYENTGYRLSEPRMSLYQLRWDLADLAVYVARFCGPHGDTADDEKSWNELESLLGRLPNSHPS